MPPPARLRTLPADVMDELERRIIRQGFSNYAGISAWLRGIGYVINISEIGEHAVKRQKLYGRMEVERQKRLIAEELARK